MPHCVLWRFAFIVNFLTHYIWRLASFGIELIHPLHHGLLGDVALWPSRSNPSALIGLFNVAMLFSLGATPFSVHFIGHSRQVPAYLHCCVLCFKSRHQGHLLWFKSRHQGCVLCFMSCRQGCALSWLSRHWGRALCIKSRCRGRALCFKSRAHLPLHRHALIFIIATYCSSLCRCTFII